MGDITPIVQPITLTAPRLIPVQVGAIRGTPISPIIIGSGMSRPVPTIRTIPLRTGIISKPKIPLKSGKHPTKKIITPRERAISRLHRTATGQNNSISPSDLSLVLKNATPEIILSLIIGLQKERINPDQVLLQSISIARKREDILPVALALRYQANPNVYTNISGIGSLHVLGYTYQQLTKLADKPVLNSIVVMLYVSGSKETLPATSDHGGGIRYEETLDLSSQPSIQEWIETEGYPSILPMLNQNLSNVSPSLLIDVGISLDRIDLIAKGENKLRYKAESSGRDQESDDTWPDLSLEAMIKAHSNQVLASLRGGRHGDNFYLSWDCDDRWSLFGPLRQTKLQPLQLSINLLNFIAFRFFMEAGYLPDYPMINEVLIEYKKYRQNRNGVALTAVSDMLDELIRVGVRIDPYQYNYLLQADPEAAKRILKEYQEPYWKKICRIEMKAPPGAIKTKKIAVPEQTEKTLGGSRLETNPSDDSPSPDDVVPRDELTEVAFNLGLPINQDRKSLCRELTRISSDDPAKLKEAAIRRQMSRISSDMSSPEEFLKGINQRSILCRNRALDKLKGKNPYAYNDVDLAFYKSQDGAVWCYVSDDFPDLLADQINPITREPLPKKLLKEMKDKQYRTEVAGMKVRDPANPPSTYQEGLQKLRQVDTVNNRENQRIEEAFFKTANLYGVSKEDISKLTKDRAESILADLGTNKYELCGAAIKRKVQLAPLDPSHARITFIRTGYQFLREESSLAPRFFESIKLITRTLT